MGIGIILMLFWEWKILVQGEGHGFTLPQTIVDIIICKSEVEDMLSLLLQLFGLFHIIGQLVNANVIRLDIVCLKDRSCTEI